MPKKINRTPEEEILFKEQQRQKANERQRQCRQRKKQKELQETSSQNLEEQTVSLSDITQSDNSTEQPISDEPPLAKKSRTSLRKNFNNVNIHQLDKISEHYIGKLNIKCIHCDALHFTAEKVANCGNSFNDCCSHGKVSLEDLPDPPKYLRSLFDQTHPMTKHFFDNIRIYNNSLAFASFNANLIDFNVNNRRPGPYCFKIQGQIYYQVNTALYPSKNENPTFGQLFFIDQNEALQHRLSIFENLDSEILLSLDQMMRDYNIFSKSYIMMKEELANQEESNSGIPTKLSLLFTLLFGSK